MGRGLLLVHRHHPVRDMDQLEEEQGGRQLHDLYFCRNSEIIRCESLRLKIGQAVGQSVKRTGETCITKIAKHAAVGKKEASQPETEIERYLHGKERKR